MADLETLGKSEADEILMAKAQAIHDRSNQAYGSPRTRNDLEEQDKDINVSRERVAWLMNAPAIVGVTATRIRPLPEVHRSVTNRQSGRVFLASSSGR